MGALVGMRAICRYCNRSEPTLVKIINEYDDFPAVKVCGVWESSTTQIDEWREAQITNGVKKKVATKRAQKKLSTKK